MDSQSRGEKQSAEDFSNLEIESILASANNTFNDSATAETQRLEIEAPTESNN